MSKEDHDVKRMVIRRLLKDEVTYNLLMQFDDVHLANEWSKVLDH